MRSPGVALFWLATILSLTLSAGAQSLPLPARATDAPTGGEFIKFIESLAFTNREEEIFLRVSAGNVPDFFRKFCPVTTTNVVAAKTNSLTFFAAPDYLAIGTDEDYFLTPMTPATAQRLADRLGCTLPTRKMVDLIYAAASVKLAPSPIPPGPAMTTAPVFAQHNAMVRTQRLAHLSACPLGALVAGNKKDVVITPRLATATNQVAIYGWHQTNGAPIQPLYLGHTASWVDYSHGIRIVQQKMTVNGETKTVAEVLADPNLADLLSDEGVITNSRYATNEVASHIGSAGIPAGRLRGPTRGSLPAGMPALPVSFADFNPSGHFGELVAGLTFAPDVKIQINAPARESFARDKPLLLIFYALPNGNTTEQTIGRKLKPGDDWHFDIQHVGAQTRFLRNLLTNRTIVIAYLEADMKSWPAWRKKNGDRLIPEIIGSVRKIFATNHVEVVLTGHSGGGSLTFGYLDVMKEIPDDVVRIAFLDSNYAYETANHLTKLAKWLKTPLTPSDGERVAARPGEGFSSSDYHSLCVLAYDDANALLDGKPFVSAAGGTWGRSHAMLRDLGDRFQFSSNTNSGLQTHIALNGRVQFLLKENPERKILHTVQVERNGFIHAMVSGTPNEGKGYEYLGERAYGKWISE